MISHLSFWNSAKLHRSQNLIFNIRDQYCTFSFGARELSCLIWSAPIRARNVVCPSATEDHELLTLQRLGGGRVRARDFWSSFRTLQTCPSLSKLTKIKEERKQQWLYCWQLYTTCYYSCASDWWFVIEARPCVCVLLGPDVVRYTIQPVIRNCIQPMKLLNSVSYSYSDARVKITDPLFFILYPNRVSQAAI